MNSLKSILGIFRKRWFRMSSTSVIVLFLYYLLFLNYNELTDVGIERNLVSGEMQMQKGGGLYFTAPWVLVAKIDTRPVRVAVFSAGHGYNAKLVQFDENHWQEFVAVEGFRYYWWANRLSFNFGYDEEHRGMKDIMRGYAYSVKKYSFIKILNEYQTDSR